MLTEIRREYPFSSKFVNLDAGQMHYIEEGDQNKRPILMVHGNPTWSFYFRNLVKFLAKDFRPIAIDHLGCGMSEKSGKGFILSQRVDHLLEFIERKKLKDITLVAHDWGGAIGMGAVTKKPELFQDIILSNTGAFISSDIPKRIAICKVPYLSKLINRVFNGFALAATEMASTRKLTSIEKKGYLLPYNNYQNRKAIDDFILDIPLSSKHKSYKELLRIEKGISTLSQKCLLIWGEKDFCFNSNFRLEFEKKLRNVESIKFANAGHYVLEDQTSEYLNEVVSFLNKDLV
jgi:haloalkane dehalogenase